MGIRLCVYSPHDREHDSGWNGTILTDVHENWGCLEHLCKEAFEESFEERRVLASTLRERLPRAVEIVTEHTHDRHDRRRMQKTLCRFVEVAEELEEDFGPPVAISLC